MTEPVVTSQTVPVRPERVWAVLSDYFALAQWAEEISHSSAMTDAPVGMGASRRVQAGPFVLIEDIVDWRPGSELAYEIRGMPPVVQRVENRWTLTPDGDGTLVSLGCVVEPGPRPPMKVAARAITRRIAKTNAGLVRDLVRHVQEGATG